MSGSATAGRAYPRETQEMVFDAHDRAFAMFKGTEDGGKTGAGGGVGLVGEVCGVGGVWGRARWACWFCDPAAKADLNGLYRPPPSLQRLGACSLNPLPPARAALRRAQ